MTRLLAILALTGSIACSSPLVATDALSTTIVTVRVFQYAAQTVPVSGARVQVNGQLGGTTSPAGWTFVTVPRNAWVDMRAEAEGYQGFSAAGLVRTPETWTFWLEAR